MTRGEFIKKTIKEICKDLWGVNYNMSLPEECDALSCPDNNPQSVTCCRDCPLSDFWDKEV